MELEQDLTEAICDPSLDLLYATPHACFLLSSPQRLLPEEGGEVTLTLNAGHNANFSLLAVRLCSDKVLVSTAAIKMTYFVY